MAASGRSRQLKRGQGQILAANPAMPLTIFYPHAFPHGLVELYHINFL